MEDTLRYDPTIGDWVDAYQQVNAGGEVSYYDNVQRQVSKETQKSVDAINIDLEVKVVTLTEQNNKLSVSYLAITKERDAWKAKAEEWKQKYAALEKDYKAALNEIVAQKLENARKDGSIKEKDRTIGLLRKLVSDVFGGLVGHHVVNNNTTNNIGGGQTQLNGGNGLQKNDK